MEIAHLRAFAAVATHRSFSAAAEQLHLTQPAISKRIALLEAKLAVRLFDRIGRRVELSEAGRALLSRVPDIERSLQLAEEAVRGHDGELHGRLRIATSHHIGLHRLPPVLSVFQRQHTAVKLDIEFLDSEQAYERLRRGDIELAIVTLAPGNASQLTSEALWPDPLSVMVAKDHVLAAKTHVDFSDLAAHAAVLPGLDTFTGRIVQRHFQQAGETLELKMATNYLETLRMMAAVGLGWTVLPDTMASPELCRLKLKKTRLERTLGLVYHEQRSLSRSAHALVALLADAKESKLE